MNTSHKTFTTDMLLKVSFLANRSDKNCDAFYFSTTGFPDVHLKVCVLPVTEHILIDHKDGKGAGVELNLCLYNLCFKRYISNNKTPPIVPKK